MNIYDRYLPQLVIDYSALHLLLYEMRTSIILLSPGGCSQPIKEIDEYRDFKDVNQYTSKMNDALITLGVESMINEKFLSNLNTNVDFISIMGSSIINIIGTDLSFVKNKIEDITKKPVIIFDTNGFSSYKKAISNSFLKLIPFILDNQENDNTDEEKEINLIGYNPLVHGDENHLFKLIEEINHENIKVCIAGISGYKKIKSKFSKNAKLSIVLSGEGVKLAQYLKDEYSIAYEKCLPVSKSGIGQMKNIIEEYIGVEYETELHYREDKLDLKIINENKKVLIIGEPFISSFLRKSLIEDFGLNNIEILSLLDKSEFTKKELKDEIYKDVIFSLEANTYIKKIKESDLVISDPLVKAIFFNGEDKKYIYLPYFGLSGREYSEIKYDYIGELGYQYLKEKLIGNGVIEYEKI